MYLNAEEYERRLESYTDSTLRLIMDINTTTSKKTADKALKITTNSELTEEQVVAQLKELLKEHQKMCLMLNGKRKTDPNPNGT